MREALPVGENLKRRGVIHNALCPHCGLEESTLHLLFHCPLATQIWSQLPVKNPITPSQISCLRSGIEAVQKLTNLPPLGLGDSPLFPWIMWTIWNARNKKLFENRSASLHESITRAVANAREWILAQPSTPSSTLTDKTFGNTSSVIDSVQCFTDAAWRGDSNDAGFGWIFTDRARNLTIQGRNTACNVSSPLMAEAMAMVLALQHARDLGFSKLSIASDSQQLIRALKSETFLKELHGIHYDILSLSAPFDTFSFNYVARDKNREADAIAKASLSSLYRH